jgi:hypothetical protein
MLPQRESDSGAGGESGKTSVLVRKALFKIKGTNLK